MSMVRRMSGGLTTSPDAGAQSVIDAGATSAVRPARLDRPLKQGSLEAGFSDPHLEERVAQAAAQAREAAQAQGYAAGWTQGRQAAAAEAQLAAVRAERELELQRQTVTGGLSQLLNGLREATTAVSQRSAQEWAEIADVLCEGALQLAQSMLSRELQSVDDAMLLNVRAALQQLADPSQAVVHLHPQDAALIKDSIDGVRVVPDPAVPVGGVVALTAAQRLRLDLPAALGAAQEVLRS